MVDWAGATHGPALYDVASAVMYIGGRQKASTFLASYVENHPGSADEVDVYIDSFSRFHAAVQASYFSKRVATSDYIGIAAYARTRGVSATHNACSQLTASPPTRRESASAFEHQNIGD